MTFTEKAKEIGLDDPGYATHASFFDFDNDGDLDMYLLNHNVVVIREFEYAKAKETRDPYAGDKLFRNDNGHFVDISEAAGIKGNPLGFGLGITVADINKDGWPTCMYQTTMLSQTTSTLIIKTAHLPIG